MLVSLAFQSLKSGCLFCFAEKCRIHASLGHDGDDINMERGGSGQIRSESISEVDNAAETALPGGEIWKPMRGEPCDERRVRCVCGPGAECAGRVLLEPPAVR